MSVQPVESRLIQSRGRSQQGRAKRAAERVRESADHGRHIRAKEEEESEGSGGLAQGTKMQGIGNRESE